MTEKKTPFGRLLLVFARENGLKQLTGVSDTALPRVEQAETKYSHLVGIEAVRQIQR